MTTGSARRVGAEAAFARLGEQIQAGISRLSVPGVAVGVWHGGREWVAGYGVTSVENPLPVTPDTLFQIGSISKTFTATAAMRLVEQGKLDLDVPVPSYLPEFRLGDAAAAASVTVRHLFNHTGGWVGDYFDDQGDGDDALARVVAKLAELPQLTPLGEVWSYNNSAFYVAGRVVEVVTGQPFEAAVAELVFAPLGLALATFFPAEAMLRRFAVGHRGSGDDVAVAHPWPIPRDANAAGGISATVRELLRYARLHLADGVTPDGTRLLSAASAQAMRMPSVQRNLRGDTCGIAWMLREVGGVQLVSHTGGTNGQMAHLMLVPGHDFAIAVLTNGARGTELHVETVRLALREYLGVDDAPATPIEFPAERLPAYAGHYVARLADQVLDVRDGGLVLQSVPKGGFPNQDSPAAPPPPPVRLAFVAKDRVIALEPPFKDAEGDFLRGPGGAISWFRFGSRIARRQDSTTLSSA